MSSQGNYATRCAAHSSLAENFLVARRGPQFALTDGDTRVINIVLASSLIIQFMWVILCLIWPTITTAGGVQR